MSDCLSPCFKEWSRQIRGMDDLKLVLYGIFDYFEQLFTSPIGQFDLLDVTVVAAVVAIVIYVAKLK